ncbi:MAG: sulfotransferase, partial [Bradymonadaceae bacterium]
EIRTPAEQQLRTLETYRKCLVKTAATGEAATPVLVAKNPAFSKRIPLIQRVFPDARFVYPVRHPVDAVAGRLELVERIWQRRSEAASLEPVHVRRLLADSIAIYRGAERGLADAPDQDKYAVRSDDFVADLVEQFDIGPVDD